MGVRLTTLSISVVGLGGPVANFCLKSGSSTENRTEFLLSRSVLYELSRGLASVPSSISDKLYKLSKPYLVSSHLP